LDNIYRRLHRFGGARETIFAHQWIIRLAHDQDRHAASAADLKNCCRSITWRTGEVEYHHIRIKLSNHVKEARFDIGRAGSRPVAAGIGGSRDRQILPRDDYRRCSHRSPSICKEAIRVAARLQKLKVKEARSKPSACQVVGMTHYSTPSYSIATVRQFDLSRRQVAMTRYVRCIPPLSVRLRHPIGIKAAQTNHRAPPSS
jgi:hypothetical protein